MSYYFSAILVVSAVLAAIYFLVRFKNKGRYDLGEFIILIVSAAGMVSAVKVMMKIQTIVGTDDDRVFVFLGLICMFWVAVQAALNVFNK
jgi:hypothetical protein